MKQEPELLIMVLMLFIKVSPGDQEEVYQPDKLLIKLLKNNSEQLESLEHVLGLVLELSLLNRLIWSLLEIELSAETLFHT